MDWSLSLLALVLAAREAELMAPGVVPRPAVETAALVEVRAALLPPRYCSEPAGVRPLPPRLKLVELSGSSLRLMTGPWARFPEAAVVEAAAGPPLLLPPTPPLAPEPRS